MIILPGHGPTTGRCVLSDRPHLMAQGVTVCEIQSWCPTEDDRLVKGAKSGDLLAKVLHN